jgi:hypothetical protein
MANAAGMLKESIWRDKEFRALPRTAQATYAQLISQLDLNRAGLQPLLVAKWIKGCDEISAEDLLADLKVLEQHRFVFVDDDTDELFVRSYMRHCDVGRYPNILKNALRCASLVASEKLRFELAQELRRLRKADADRVADAIEPTSFEPETRNRSGTQMNGSGTVPDGLKGSETVREPQGSGSGSGSVTLGSSSGGEDPAESRIDESAAVPNFPDHCIDHRQLPDPPPCHRCRKTREANEAQARTNSDAAYQARAAERAQRAASQAACTACDPEGWLLDIWGEPTDPAIRCQHPGVA